MKTFIVPVVVSALLFAVSCKKDRSPHPVVPASRTSTANKSYMPMKKGAYWLYKNGTMDTLDNITFTRAGYDSVYVSGDTIINGAKHFILKHTMQGFTYFGFTPQSMQCYQDSASQYIMPYYFTSDQIGDTLEISTSFPWFPGLMVYSMPNYYSNMQTSLGVKSGLRIESHQVYPAGYPEYYNRYFCYDAYLENVGMNRKVLVFSSGSDTRLVYELIGYGGLD